MMNVFKCSVALVAAGLLAVTAQAGPVQVIDDRSFFDNIPHTLIDFETRGNGTPFPLEPGRTIGVVPDDFASFGVVISGSPGFPGTRIVKTFEEGIGRAALEAAGSYPNYLVDFNTDGFIRFDFTIPVQSFGLAGMRSLGIVSDAMRLEAMDMTGTILATITFDGSLIDGIIQGEPFGTSNDIEFGFWGIASPGQAIYSILIHDAGFFDDVYFSSVPEPATWLGFGLIAAYCAWRRRRGAAALAALVFAGVTMTTQAGPVQVIDNRSFFDNIPHTLIDFSTRGNGTAWPPLTPGQTFGFSEAEYTSSGVRISTAGNSPFFPRVARSPDSGAIPVALEQAGSAPFYISEFAADGYLRFDFEEPIQAFGIAVLRTAGSNVGPVLLEAIDMNGAMLGMIPFEGDLVDGVVNGTPFGGTFDIEYGFLGIQSPGISIATVFLYDDSARYDDLHFSIIPEPATWLGIALFAVLCASRRPVCRSQAQRRHALTGAR